MVAGDLAMITDQVKSVTERDVLGCRERQRHARRNQCEYGYPQQVDSGFFREKHSI
jgi:hypothetical protein